MGVVLVEISVWGDLKTYTGDTQIKLKIRRTPCIHAGLACLYFGICHTPGQQSGYTVKIQYRYVAIQIREHLRKHVQIVAFKSLHQQLLRNSLSCVGYNHRCFCMSCECPLHCFVQLRQIVIAIGAIVNAFLQIYFYFSYSIYRMQVYIMLITISSVFMYVL